MAGKESVIKFINKRCAGKNGVGKINKEASNTHRIPAKFLDNK